MVTRTISFIDQTTNQKAKNEIIKLKIKSLHNKNEKIKGCERKTCKNLKTTNQTKLIVNLYLMKFIANILLNLKKSIQIQLKNKFFKIIKC